MSQLYSGNIQPAIPIVLLFFANTIAFDFTCLHTFNAKIKSCNICLEAFILDTHIIFFEDIDDAVSIT